MKRLIIILITVSALAISGTYTIKKIKNYETTIAELESQCEELESHCEELETYAENSKLEIDKLADEKANLEMKVTEYEAKIELYEIETGYRGNVVCITKNGKKYHRLGCHYLSKEKNWKTFLECAEAMGLSPCSSCHP